MRIKYFVYAILVTSVFLLSLSSSTYAGNMRIGGTLEKESKAVPGAYGFPKDLPFEFTNNTKLCPSNQCKLIQDPLGVSLALREDLNSMSVFGAYRIQDDITNGHFTPKKQQLVERISLLFFCNFDDIQENKNGTTKYLCSHPTMPGVATRTFNNTAHTYDFSASFELPSRHFVLNAQDRE